MFSSLSVKIFCVVLKKIFFSSFQISQFAVPPLGFSVLFCLLLLLYCFHFVDCIFVSLFFPSHVFIFIPFDSSSSIENSPLKASVSLWIVCFHAGSLLVILFLFFILFVSYFFVIDIDVAYAIHSVLYFLLTLYHSWFGLVLYCQF